MGCFEIRISTILARVVKSKLTRAYAQVIIVILHPATCGGIKRRLCRKEDYNGGVYSAKVQDYKLYKRFCLEGVCGSE